jgi:hypothetical protein
MFSRRRDSPAIVNEYTMSDIVTQCVHTKWSIRLPNIPHFNHVCARGTNDERLCPIPSDILGYGARFGTTYQSLRCDLNFLYFPQIVDPRLLVQISRLIQTWRCIS